MELPIRGTDKKKWVLICNINPGGPYGGSATQYFVGDFDGKRFTCDTAPNVTKWMDYGKDHYAAVSWNSAPNGRHTMIAWMNNWQYANNVPVRQYHSANTLPREVELYQGRDGEYYLASMPSPEVNAVRGKAVNLGVVGQKGVEIPTDCLGACEVEYSIRMGKAKTVNISLSNKLGEKVVLTYNKVEGIFSMDRTKSGETGFSADFPAVTSAPVGKDNLLRIRLFIDRSSLEVFERQGRFTMTNIVFPNEPYSFISVSSTGATAKVKATIYDMNHQK